ncbi:MAG: M20/M25/M40 family metallo-hydrolase [Myxococcota bacterium]
MTTLDELAGRALEHCRDRLRTMDKLLEALVRISSASEDADGNRRCLEVIAGGLNALGFKATILVTESGREHLLARREGRAGAPKVIMLGHTDTVFEASHPFRGYWIEGDYGRGPGVADMKGGLVVLLSTLDALAGSGLLEAFELRVLVSTDHQQQSATSHNAIRRLCEGADLALSFESATEDGALVRSRPGTGRFLFTVQGRAASIGRPDEGRNAILELGRKMPRIDALREPDRGVHVNCGVVSGGSRANVVADEASLLVGVRCEAPDDAAWLGREMRAVADETREEGFETVVSGGIARPPWPRDDDSDTLVAVWRRAGRAVGLSGLVGVHGAGGSDGNFTHDEGVPTIDGLGPRGGALHTPDEWVDLRSMAERSAMSAMGLVLWRARRAKIEERRRRRREESGAGPAPGPGSDGSDVPHLRPVPEPSEGARRAANGGPEDEQA